MLAALALGATVEIEGGDRISGEVVGLAEGELRVKTGYLGVVAIPLERIAHFAAEVHLWARTPAGPVRCARVEVRDGVLVAFGEDGVPIEAAALSESRPGPPEPSPPAPAPPRWKDGEVSVGGIFIRGGTRADNLNFQVKATRAWEGATLGMRGRYNLVTREGNRVKSRSEALARYDRELGGRDYWYADASALRDTSEGVDWRGTQGLGLGRTLLEREGLRLGMEGGLQVQEEHRVAGDRYTDLQARLGQTLAWRLPGALLEERLDLYPNLTASQRFRTVLEASLTADLTEKVKLRIGLSGEFEDTPPEEGEKLELRATVSLVYKMF